MKNCWEFKQCGREFGGSRAGEMGVCPAATEKALDGVHGGRYGGRACWVVVGTFCNGEVQGTYAKKYADCSKCDFYRSVWTDEGGGFVLSSILLDRIRTRRMAG